MSRPRARFAVAALVAPSLVAALAGAGCGNVVKEKNSGTDIKFLRAPNETPEPVEMREGSLFPMRPGDRWTMTVRTGEGAEARESVEEVVVIGTAKVGADSGVALDIRKNGKTDRQEVYRLDAKGLTLLAAGSPGDRMTLAPPLPLIRTPIADGEATPWEGILRYRGTQAPGTALSRVSGRTMLKTPAGEFGVYRVDTIITTTVQGQQVSFPTTRWIAPGIGVVRQKLLSGQTLVVKELKSYRMSGTGGGGGGGAAL